MARSLSIQTHMDPREFAAILQYLDSSDVNMPKTFSGVLRMLVHAAMGSLGIQRLERYDLSIQMIAGYGFSIEQLTDGVRGRSLQLDLSAEATRDNLRDDEDFSNPPLPGAIAPERIEEVANLFDDPTPEIEALDEGKEG
jgi:hypothetical protein